MTQIIFAPDPQYKVLDWTLERYHRAIEAGVFGEGISFASPFAGETIVDSFIEM